MDEGGGQNVFVYRSFSLVLALVGLLFVGFCVLANLGDEPILIVLPAVGVPLATASLTFVFKRIEIIEDRLTAFNCLNVRVVTLRIGSDTKIRFAGRDTSDVGPYDIDDGLNVLSIHPYFFSDFEKLMNCLSAAGVQAENFTWESAVQNARV